MRQEGGLARDGRDRGFKQVLAGLDADELRRFEQTVERKRPVNPTPPNFGAGEFAPRSVGAAAQAAMSRAATGRSAVISDCFQPEASFSRTSLSHADGSTPRSRQVPSTV